VRCVSVSKQLENLTHAMAAQLDTEKLKKLNWRIPWPEWFAGSSVKTSAGGSAGTPERSQVETVAKSSESTPERSSVSSSATSPAGSTESYSGVLPPLDVVKIGDTVRVDRPIDEAVEWNNAMFARLFLEWLVGEPIFCGAWVSAYDIDTELLPRFQLAADCPHLEAGALRRGLAEVTAKRERATTDRSGKRISMTEYLIPKPAAEVVEFEAAKRQRA
jgi:hypothetical protein